MKIGILAIGMVVLFIASTIPAVSGAPPDQTPTMGIIASPPSVEFNHFVTGDTYSLTVINGLGPGSNVALNLTDEVITMPSDTSQHYTVCFVTEEPVEPSDECDCNEYQVLGNGRYTVTVSAVHEGTAVDPISGYIVVKN